MECLSAIGVAESFFEATRPIRNMVSADGGRKIAEVPLAEGLNTLWPTPLIRGGEEKAGLRAVGDRDCLILEVH